MEVLPRTPGPHRTRVIDVGRLVEIDVSRLVETVALTNVKLDGSAEKLRSLKTHLGDVLIAQVVGCENRVSRKNKDVHCLMSSSGE